jgi:hypothetical protein
MATGRISFILRTITLLITIISLSFPAYAQYGGGSGEPNDPYLIYTAEHLNAIGAEPNNWDKDFKLMADIDMQGAQYDKAVIAWDTEEFDFMFTGTSFTGTFDGGGNQIANLAIDTGSVEKGLDYLGLFGSINAGAVIKNLEIVNLSVSGGTNSDYIGAIAGEVVEATIENCYSSCTITSQLNSQYIGGLAGMCQTSTIKSCRTNCSITANNDSSNLGGMIGSLDNATVSDCHSSGSVSGSTLSRSIGGLIGNAGRATITNCSSDSSVSGGTGASYIGGLIGIGYQLSVKDCHSAGTVSGGPISYNLGGLAGYLGMETILTDCWSEADVVGDSESFNVGGLIGATDNTSLFACYSKGAVSAGINSDYMGGLVGYYKTTFTRKAEDYYLVIDCNSSSTVTGRENSDNVGGLIGRLDWGGIIFNCHSTGDVKGEEEIGGLVGWNTGNIVNSYSTGNLTGEFDADRLGGLVGRNTGTIDSCYASGSITGGYNSDHLGGLAGKNEDTILDCYATGSVFGGLDAEDLGGLVGYNTKSGSIIRNCYSTGAVSSLSDSEFIGGFLGNHENGRVLGCFWNTDTAGTTKGTGVIGPKSDAHELTGLTTVQMGDMSYFTGSGWAFFGETGSELERNWIMFADSDRPALRWQHESDIELPAFSGGSGTQDDPYLIAGADDLHNITYSPRLLDKNFKLVADIDMDGSPSLTVIGSRMCPFSGDFDGNNHRIYNLSGIIMTRYHHNKAMIGSLDRNGQVRNLELSVQIQMPVQDCLSLGGLVGYIGQGTITNCHVGGKVEGTDNVGGLAGFSKNGSISNCSAAVETIGNDCVGGFTGYNNGTISTSYSTGTMKGNSNVGGFAGYNDGGITSCQSTAAVDGNERAGGFAGYNDNGNIATSYSTGAVTGVKEIGGLVGNNHGKITSCYSTGFVTGDKNLGSLVGAGIGAASYHVNASFWDMETSGQTDSYGGTGKTTDEMQTPGTFLEAGWDFVGETENGTEDIWWILEGQDYPRLWWEADNN